MSAAVIDAASAKRRERASRLRGLYAVTPELADTEDLIARVDAALTGGACAVQYRNKSLGARERERQAAALAPVVRARHALFIVNDDARLAAQLDADGVHLGEDDGTVAAARECVGPARIIGISCYNEFQRAEAAVAAGADYIAFGSFFVSSVKPNARRADVSLLKRARLLDLPIVAIGGITANNAGDLARAGADAVAVISDVFASPDPSAVREAARALCVAMTGNRLRET